MTDRAIIQTPAGLLRIDCADEFVTGINFVDEGELVDNTTNFTFQTAVAELRQYFEGKCKAFTFPHRQHGTAFQQEVWSQLMQIPFGATITYKELAQRLGDEKKIRAAASANGKNNLAILVPCHRVIGAGGQLVGYAGGLDRKRWLLMHEAGISGRPLQAALF